jgi:hypothetical protein
MPFELINAETTNTIASFESEEEAQRELERISRTRPALAEATVIVPFDADGLAVDPGQIEDPGPIEALRAALTPPDAQRAGTGAWDDAFGLAGFSVEAVNGSIGKLHRATSDVAPNYIVVDTGPWIFGVLVLLPASVVRRVDRDQRTVHIALDKDEVAKAPRFDEERLEDEAYLRGADTYLAGRKSER